MTKCLKTLKKTLIFGYFGPMLPIFWKKEFSWEIGLCEILDFTIYNYYHHAKRSEQSNERLPRRV